MTFWVYLTFRSWDATALSATDWKIPCCFWGCSTNSCVRARVSSACVLSTSIPVSKTPWRNFKFRSWAATALSAIAWFTSRTDLLRLHAASFTLSLFIILLLFFFVVACYKGATRALRGVPSLLDSLARACWPQVDRSSLLSDRLTAIAVAANSSVGGQNINSLRCSLRLAYCWSFLPLGVG